ncbi:hypothetical protein [Caballeronia sp. J97]|uniref:hypothetical protein n=1 Tax=Caballeronia sp. J97 TaxID=2805429 RepID=UPI002AB290E6|nr:hypothetical protein [Caballeronia sp. J97]
MNSLFFENSARDGSRAENASKSSAVSVSVDARNNGALNERDGARTRYQVASQYDWMDHHSTFATSEW